MNWLMPTAHPLPGSADWMPKPIHRGGHGGAVLFYGGMHLRDYCRSVGMSYETVRKRLKRGWEIERAVLQERFRPATTFEQKYTVFGMSVKSYCERHGINETTVYGRIRRKKMTAEEACSLPVKKRAVQKNAAPA